MNYKELRERMGWTQVQAAVACGVSLATWRLWELGGGNPNDENWDTVLKVFGRPEGQK